MSENRILAFMKSSDFTRQGEDLAVVGAAVYMSSAMQFKVPVTHPAYSNEVLMQTLSQMTSQLSLMNERLAALESKVGIQAEDNNSRSLITDELKYTISRLAATVFNTNIATIEAAENDGAMCLFVSVNVGPDAAPEEMSQKKSELHKLLLSESTTATQNIRIKVIYG